MDCFGKLALGHALLALRILNIIMGGRRLVSRGSRLSSSGDESEVPVVACNMCGRDPPTNRVVTTCGHSFCGPCMLRFVERQARPCPVCTTMLSCAIHVVPRRHSDGSLILCLPTVEELERNYDMLDWMRTNTALQFVPARQPARPWANLSRNYSEKRGHVVVFDEGNRNCERNLFLTSRIEELQWRIIRRAKLTKLCKSWQSWSTGRKDK